MRSGVKRRTGQPNEQRRFPQKQNLSSHSHLVSSHRCHGNTASPFSLPLLVPQIGPSLMYVGTCAEGCGVGELCMRQIALCAVIMLKLFAFCPRLLSSCRILRSINVFRQDITFCGYGYFTLFILEVFTYPDIR